MKYSEFREYLKGTDFEIKEDSAKVEVNIGDFGCVEISKTTRNGIILPFSVEEPEQFELIRKALELAETPLDEREEEKKYYLKHKFINFHTAVEYINLTTTGNVVLSDRLEDHYYKTKFTKAEIEEFKKRFNTDLNDFELVEVEN